MERFILAGDLHCHTRLSDGSLGIEDLIMLAKKRGVKTIAITDHDCLAGTVRGKIIGDRNGVKVIPGVELSSIDIKTGKKVHLLCYLPDSPDRLEGLCRRNLIASKRASQYMVLKVAKKYPITHEFVIKCASGSTNVYVQHIMQALLECGLTDRFYGELYDELFSPESDENVLVDPKHPDFRDVLEAIHDSGGISVLAHPGLYDNFDIIDELVELGLDGLEVWNPNNSEEDTQRLTQIATEKELLMVGGSDFHGMYNKHNLSIGDYTTPKENLAELLGYKAKQRRLQKKADAENLEASPQQ